jgi:mRNA-degrading endonuclease RelE of RelBE toxin-antitoxin system
VVVYQLVIKKKALEFVNTLPTKSQKIVIEKCKTLADDPYPGQGDKEIIQRKGHKDIYRLHISRSYTAFYKIYKDEKMVKILDITTIEQAHKIYGRF